MNPQPKEKPVVKPLQDIHTVRDSHAPRGLIRCIFIVLTTGIFIAMVWVFMAPELERRFIASIGAVFVAVQIFKAIELAKEIGEEHSSAKRLRMYMPKGDAQTQRFSKPVLKQLLIAGWYPERKVRINRKYGRKREQFPIPAKVAAILEEFDGLTIESVAPRLGDDYQITIETGLQDVKANDGGATGAALATLKEAFGGDWYVIACAVVSDDIICREHGAIFVAAEDLEFHALSFDSFLENALTGKMRDPIPITYLPGKWPY